MSRLLPLICFKRRICNHARPFHRTVWHAGYVDQQEATLLEEKIKALTEQLSEAGTNNANQNNSKDKLIEKISHLKKEYEKVAGEPFEG